MNKKIFNYSESLLLSLSKEIEYIKSRSKNINYSLKTCQNKLLSKRLREELNKLNKNRLKILTVSENMFKKNCNELCFEFLFEITKRSNSLQQI